MSKRQVQNSIEKLREKRLIQVKAQRKKNGALHYNRYSLNLSEIDADPIAPRATTYSTTCHRAIAPRATTKDKHTKEERESWGDVFRALTAHEHQRIIERYLDDVSNEVNVMNPSAYKAKIRREISKRNENTQNALTDWYLKNEVRRLRAAAGEDVRVYTFRETKGYAEREDFDPDRMKIFYAEVKDEFGGGQVIGADKADELLQMIDERNQR